MGQWCGINVFFVIIVNKLMEKQSSCRWFKTLERPCDVTVSRKGAHDVHPIWPTHSANAHPPHMLKQLLNEHICWRLWGNISRMVHTFINVKYINEILQCEWNIARWMSIKLPSDKCYQNISGHYSLTSTWRKFNIMMTPHERHSISDQWQLNYLNSSLFKLT